jgi:hypothetical protein
MNSRATPKIAGLMTALTLAALANTAIAAAPTADTAVLVNPLAAGEVKAPAPTYTRNQIRNAKPLPFAASPTPGATGAKAAALPAAGPASTAPIVTVEPGLPDPQADLEAQRDFPDEWALLEQTPALAATAGAAVTAGHMAMATAVVPKPLDIARHPYTLYPGNYWTQIQTQFPWKAVGKLVFRDGKSIYVGTANVINSPQGNLIVTAAHNVWDSGKKRFFKDFVFIPAERDGIQPYGQFPFKTVRVLSRYQDAGGEHSSRDDVALLTLNDNQAGKPVTFYTGWLGLKINLPYTLDVTAMGYSANGVISSRATTISTGQTFAFDGKDCPQLRGGEDILFMGSRLTSGASGGAWLYHYQPFAADATGNYVTSVVSGGMFCENAQPVPEILLGARFSDANIGLLCAHEGCTPDPLP